MDKTNQLMISERLNRLVKLAMDTGEVGSLEEAERLFASYSLGVAVGADAARSATHQAALLTIVNTGRRSLLGGIYVQGLGDTKLLVSISPYRTLEEAVSGLGGHVVKTLNPELPLIALGDVPDGSSHPFAIRTTFDGWSAGITPFAESSRLSEQREFTPSGVLAAALAVTEAFQYLRGNNPMAGRRRVGLSLWRPELDWRDRDAIGPSIDRLPAALWLIGLGNLGQAYLWTLGLLPYAEPGAVRLILQDFDVLAESNESTSLLTSASILGSRKTRAMAAWAERRGFCPSIVERRFGANFCVDPDEPGLALCGVDNALARTGLEDVGFGRIIEAGLGGGVMDFLGFRMHTFPGARRARDIWRPDIEIAESPIDRPAYAKLAAAGLDPCGLTQLAGRTVGAPFVGAVASALVVAEALRIVNGGHGYDLIDGHLRDLTHRTVISAADQPPFNAGTIKIA